MNSWTTVVCGKQKFQWDVKQKVELSSAFIRPQPQGDQLTAHFNWSMKLSKVFYGSCSLKSTKASSNLNSFVSSSSNRSIFGHDNAFVLFQFCHKGSEEKSLSVSKRNLVINCQSCDINFDFHRWHPIPDKSETIAAVGTEWKSLWFTPCNEDNLLPPAPENFKSNYCDWDDWIFSKNEPI